MSLSTLLIYSTGRPGKLFHLNLKAQVPALAFTTSTTGFASDLPHVALLTADFEEVTGRRVTTLLGLFATCGSFFPATRGEGFRV